MIQFGDDACEGKDKPIVQPNPPMTEDPLVQSKTPFARFFFRFDVLLTLSFLAICLCRFKIFFVALSSLVTNDSTTTSVELPPAVVGALSVCKSGSESGSGFSFPARRMWPPVMQGIVASDSSSPAVSMALVAAVVAVVSAILCDAGVGRAELGLTVEKLEDGTSEESPPRIRGSTKPCVPVDGVVAARLGNRRFHGEVDLPSTESNRNASRSKDDEIVAIDTIVGLTPLMYSLNRKGRGWCLLVGVLFVQQL